MASIDKDFALPEHGFVQWPVGTGDSTTICVTDEIVMQVDLHHLACAEEDEDPRTPIVDRLISSLPKKGKRPYLATFVLTHPDEDHCLGFEKLLANVEIGEIWFSPRVFREYKKELCADALVFREEAVRRVKKAIAHKGDVLSGDRVRIIGYDDLLKEDEYQDFPRGCFSVPGHELFELDGVDLRETFRIFLHGPFKEHADGERNDCSIAMQVRLEVEGAYSSILLLGDHCYPTLKKIFEYSDSGDVEWNVILAPHHCSKSAMYWQDEGDEEATLHQDILDLMEAAALEPGYVVSSSEPIPATNKKGDNPPHARAKARYQEIAPTGFLCTQEHGEEDQPSPIIFLATKDGLVYLSSSDSSQPKMASLTSAAAFGRGSKEPPASRVGFGVDQ